MPVVNYDWDELEDNIVEEYDDAGNTLATYTTEPELHGNLISQNRGGVESQYHFDAQGSTLALTDADQQVTDTYAYTAFGERTERTGTTENPFQYIGQKQYRTDGVTGDIDVRRRPYRPKIARWLSVDPLMYHYRLKGYEYASNIPVLAADPSGLCPKCPVAWKAPPVLGVEYQYGCYCGKEPTPPRVAPPPPIDPIDVCCQAHDACCGVPGITAAGKTLCNANMCACAKKAIGSDCATTAADIRCCCTAAKSVSGLFCAVTVEFCGG